MNVRLGDGNCMHAHGHGQIRTNAGIIENVFYVPSLVTNLFSIRAATRQNIVVQYTMDDVKLIKNDVIVLRGSLCSGVYTLDLQVIVPEQHFVLAATLEDWHKRFDHVSMTTIKNMIKNNSVVGLNVRENVGYSCAHCALGKCTHSSHPSRQVMNHIKAEQILHFDTVIMVNSKSINGNLYFLLCKDELSGYRMGAFLSSKVEVANQVKQMITESKIATGNSVLKICTDNGSEFVNQDLSSHLQNLGIVHDRALPYVHQQNGFVERDVRTVVESGRTLLIASNLPKILWDEAIACSLYILNRTTNSRNQLQTPYELWTGCKPDVANLRVFGQDAIIYDNNYKKKFDPRGFQVKFVGYTKRSNSYRFFDGKRIISSCDVRFIINRQLDTNIVNHETSIDQFQTSSDPICVSNNSNASTTIQIPQPHEPTISTSPHSELVSPQNVDERNHTTITSAPGISENLNCFDESYDSLTSSEFDTTVIEKRQSTPKSFAKRLNIGLGKLIPFHKKTNETLSISQPCIQHRISSDDHGNLIVQDPNKSDAVEITEPYQLLMSASTINDPATFEEAMSRPDKDQWVQAMKEEIDSMHKNHVWTLVDKPSGVNIVSNRWIFVIKRKPNGDIDRYKARLVARGFSQTPGFDYHETYAPVAYMPTIRILFAFAAAKHLKIAGFDVKTAFLYGHLDEKIYMEQPLWYRKDMNKVCLLNRSLYGLKQSPRQWNLRFTNFIVSLNLKMSENDRCVFYKTNPLVILAIYVDDGLVFAENQDLIKSVIDRMKNEFEIHEVSPTTYLGFQIKYDDGKIFLHQSSYINTILENFEMERCSPATSPIVSQYQQIDYSPALGPGNKFREAVGTLMYIAVTTRPDIMYSVMRVSVKVCNPTETDWQAIKRIFRYLRGTTDYGILYSNSNSLQAFCDADFAGDRSTSKSTSGLLIMLSGGPVHWKSKGQKIVTLSSTEAELVSLCSAVKDIVWLRKLSIELQIIDHSATNLFCDNQSTIRLALNEKACQRTRHMSVRAAYPREKVENKEVNIAFVKTQNQMADMLTKRQEPRTFMLNRDIIMRKISLFNVILSIIILTMTGIAYSDAKILERTDPVLWRSTNKLVYGKRIEFKILLMWMNPCKEFESHSNAYPHKDAKKQCETQYQTEWINNIKELGKLHNSSTARQAGLLAGITQVGYQIITNLISFASCFVYFGYTRSNTHIYDKLTEYKNTQSAIKDIVTKVVESMGIMGTSLQTLKQQYDENWYYHDQVYAMIGVLNEINKNGNRLRIITEKAKQGQVAMRELGYIMNLNSTTPLIYGDFNINFFDFKPEYTEFIAAEEVDNGKSLHFNFAIIIEYPNAKIYEVDTFNYWNILKTPPELMTYTGKKYVLHDKQHNCRKAITDTQALLIAERCTNENYLDPRLDKWEKVETASNMSELDPQVMITKFYNYIYCFPNNITIFNISQYCPPSVFKLPVDVSFETGNIEMQSVTVTLNMTKRDLVFDNSHYNDVDVLTLNERSLISNQQNLTDQVKELELMNNRIIVDNRHSIHWHWIVSSFILYTILIGLVSCYLYNYSLNNGRQAVNSVNLQSNESVHCLICQQRKNQRDRTRQTQVDTAI